MLTHKLRKTIIRCLREGWWAVTTIRCFSIKTPSKTTFKHSLNRAEATLKSNHSHHKAISYWGLALNCKTLIRIITARTIALYRIRFSRKLQILLRILLWVKFLVNLKIGHIELQMQQSRKVWSSFKSIMKTKPYHILLATIVLPSQHWRMNTWRIKKLLREETIQILFKGPIVRHKRDRLIVRLVSSTAYPCSLAIR